MRSEKTDACDKTGGCSGCDQEGSCSQDEKEKHEAQQLAERLSHIRHSILIMSGKGGVGKSTVAANLAVSLAREGFQVGLLDADLHGPNIPKMLGIEGKVIMGSPDGMLPIEVLSNLKVISVGFLLKSQDDPVIWRGPLKHAVIRQFLGEVAWGELDYLIVDLPPGTGDEPLSIAQEIKNPTGSVIVTTPQEVALLDSRKSVNFSRSLNIKVLGIVENMSGMKCPHCGKAIDLFKVGGGEKAAREMNVPFLGRIPLDPEVVQEADRGRPFAAYAPESPAAQAFIEITKKIIR